MKLLFTKQAQKSLTEVASYLLENQVDKKKVKTHLEEIKQGLKSLLTTFPEAGVVTRVGNMLCRRVNVKGYSVLYYFDSSIQSITILLVYRENVPKLRD